MSRDRIGALCMLAFSIAYGVFSQQIPLLPFQRNQAFTAQTMPEALAILGIVLSLILLIRPGSDARIDVTGYNWGRAAALCVLMVLYGFGVRPAGFIVATILFLAAGFWVLGERRPTVLLGVSVPIVVGFWALMTQGLDVFIEPLPAFLTE